MPEILGGTDFLLALEAFALVAVIIRLLVSGLFRIYPFFFWYLVTQGVQMAIPLFLSNTSTRYLYVYLITEGIITCLYALVILELYSLVLKGHAGIASAAKRYVRRGLAFAILLSVLILQAERVPSLLRDRFFIVERTMVSSILFFVLAITAFLVYYPVRLNRNTIYYSIGYSIYFTSKAIILFILNTGRSWYAPLETVLLIVVTGCLLFWALFLSRKGEERGGVIGHRWAPADETRLLQQLEAINQSLIHARKEIPTNSR